VPTIGLRSSERTLRGSPPTVAPHDGRMAARLEVGLLGPVEVRRDGATVALAGWK
jgi:hypothetical protein